MSFYHNHLGIISALINNVQQAFAGVTLEDGIGLVEGDVIDSYWVSIPGQFESIEERDDWQKITDDYLLTYHSGIFFVDGKGMRFTLPALLISSLRNTDLECQAYVNLYTTLSYRDQENDVDIFSTLNCAQCEVTVHFFQLLKQKFLFEKAISDPFDYTTDLDELEPCLIRWQKRLADLKLIAAKDLAMHKNSKEQQRLAKKHKADRIKAKQKHHGNDSNIL